jgi:hypothetical protein
MTSFAEEFEYLMARNGGRRAFSPNETIDAWQSFVAECEDGYTFGIYEFENDLSVRDRIHLALQSATLSRYEELSTFRVRSAEIDKRFKALVAAGPKVRANEERWWRRRLPAVGGEELADDATRLYGVEITVV